MRKKNNSTQFIIALLFFAACTSQPKETKSNSGNDTILSDSSVFKPANDPFLKNGEEKEKYPNGVLKTQGNYKKGKRDGPWYSWYNTGKPWSETSFDNGLKDGPTKSWYENGNLRYEGQYSKDVKSGNWKFYEENGKLSKTVKF